MKKIMLVIYISLCFFNCNYSQVNYDKINIYIYSQYIGLGMMDKCVHNEDYTRVHAPIRITIKEKNMVEQFEKKILETEKIPKSEISGQFVCQVVIDFIKSERILKTVAIDNLKEMKLDGDSITYKPDHSISDFLITVFPYFLN